MAIQVFPTPSTSSAANTLAQTFTAVSSSTLYSATSSLATGTYTITCASGTVAHIDFFSGSTYIGSAVTVSGVVTYNLGTAATKIDFWTNTGSNIVISLQLTGQALTTNASGSVTQLTTSGTYNSTGTFYVTTVGGGGGGGGGTPNGASAGGSGGGGGSASGILTVSSPVSYTIGAAGNGGAVGTAGSQAGNAGGATNFGGYQANGGNGGGNYGANGSGGSYSGSPYGASGSVGNHADSYFPFLYSSPSSNNGAGGAGVSYAPGASGKPGIVYIMAI